MSTRFSSKTLKTLTLAVICGMSLPTGAFAQVLAQVNTNSIPVQVNPGAVNNAPANREQPPETIRTDDAAEDLKLVAPDQQQQAGPTSSVRFTINTISIDGVTLLKEEEFRPLIQQYEGKEGSLNDLTELTEKLNALYREKGYLTSQVYIPPQDNVEQGNIKLTAVEGKIGDIQVDGNRFFRTKAILRNLPQQEGEMLNVKDLEDSLNRINQQDQFRLRATLTPGEETGETDVKLDVAERQPWQITPTFDNQGRPFIGTYRVGGEISNNNLFGLGDRFFLKYFQGRRHLGVGTSYAVPINRFGTELGLNFGFNHVDPNIPVRNQPSIIGNAYFYGITLAQPLDKERNWVADVGFNAKRISTFINDDRAEPNGRDDIRSIVTGLTYNNVDRLGRTFARGQMTFAPGWMGADTKFWKAETFLTRVLRLPANNLLLFRAYGQFTPDALVPAEMMQLGGAFSVRGYSEGLLLGDRGYQLNLEHRWPVPGLRLVSPWLADRVQGAFFVDFGQTFLDNSQRGRNRFIFRTNSNNTTLLGVGFGARARLTRFLQGFVDCGFGLLDTNAEPYGQPTARVHFGIRSDLLPDTYKTQATPEEEAKKQAAADEKAQKKAEKLAAKEAKRAAKNNPSANPVLTPIQPSEQSTDVVVPVTVPADDTMTPAEQATP